MSPGDVIGGKYRLDRLLGEGGMGVVWAATHLVTHKALALKLVHAETGDPVSRSRALREARAACAITHPNVVAVHDVLGSDDDMPVLVMDLLRGESLRARLEREKTISVHDAVAYGKKILAGLEAAHAVGIIHRDLKPDNVFLTDDGGLVVLDFGVAKLRGHDVATRETSRLTETGAMIGTPQYMAPEQAFAEGELDARADLWAAGALLFECLAGAPPTAEGTNIGQILKLLATGKIPRLVERVPTAPPKLLVLVDRLLSIDREDRPASARDVITALEAISDLPSDRLPVQGSSPRASATPDTPPPATRTAPPSRPFRFFSPGAIAAAAVVIVLGTFTTWRLTHPVPTVMEPPPIAAAPPIAAELPPPASASVALATPAPPSSSAPPPVKRARAIAPPKATTSAANPLLPDVPY